MIQVEWLLNGVKMTLAEFTGYVTHMEKEISENVNLFIYCRLHHVMLRIHRCLVNDCHYKLVKWLCENYRIILLPEFRTQEMIRCGQRQIGSKTARAMCTWSHFHFRQHLIHKAREYPWCQVVICTEEYTSKTCGFSGYIHKKLSGFKEFCCPNTKQNLIGI